MPAARNSPDGLPASAPHVAFFDQLTRYLEHLAQHQPLLLTLDNLQWADASTIALLFHLAKRLAHSRVLIVGAYRPGALALAQVEQSHSLTTVVQELRQQPGTFVIDLDRVDGRRFIDALLDRDPNRFDEQFREKLVRHTEGHALFTVELLHVLRETGYLTQDRDGCWQAEGEVNWDAQPPHIEALIRQRVELLSPADRALLNAACVEGDEFTAEIAAAISGIDPRSAIERLSGDLTTKHRMVYATRTRQLPGASFACYRFRHHLFRAFLCAMLDAVQRDRLQREAELALARLGALHSDEPTSPPAISGLKPVETV